MSQVATINEGSRQVARPLKVLVPLIKEDLEQGKEASDRAGLPYYRAAGEKMLEAKGQIDHGEFQGWIKRSFGISPDHARKYMQLAKVDESGFAKPFSSLSDFVRQTSSPNYNKPHTVRPQAWHEPVKGVMDRVNVEALNRRADDMKRADEREEQRKLALQLIDIGYKALASKLHPDKGGSRDAMSRLNQVRDRLKSHV